MTADITLNSSTGGFPPTGHYSHSTTTGGFVFISGQLPVAFDSGKKIDASFEGQTQLVPGNINTYLAGARTSRQRLMSVRIYVADMSQWPTFNKTYEEWIGSFRPSRAVAGVAELHYGFALEVEAIALAP